jgi:transcriptional accessory protein Tex/SPT6
VDKYEVPFIWLYRRDYFSSLFTRNILWQIFWLDIRFTALFRVREKIHANITKLLNLSNSTEAELDREPLDAAFKNISISSASEILKKFPVSQYFAFLSQNMEEVALSDTIIYMKLIIDSVQSKNSINEGLELDLSKKERNKSSKYFKYKTMPSVQSFVDSICASSEAIGAALLYDGNVDIPNVIRTVEEVAEEIRMTTNNFSSNEQLLSAATIVVGTELSLEPSVRKTARVIFRNHGTISTRPTPAGKTAITPFSQFFGIHYLEQKPIKLFFQKEGLMQFMNIIEAESLGLIEVLVNPPQKLVANKLSTDLDPFFSGFFHLFMPREPATMAQNPAARQSWDMIRLNVLGTIVEKYLIPFLKSDLRSELLRRGKEVISDAVAKEFEKRLNLGPCEPFYEDNREFITRKLLSCPERFVYSKVAGLYAGTDKNSGLCMACVDSNGVLLAHQTIASQSMGQKKDKIKAFLYDNRPDLVVINSGGGGLSREIHRLIMKEILDEISETVELDRQLRRSQASQGILDLDEEDEELNVKYSPNVRLGFLIFLI